ncbi:protein of unknown function [Nocardia cyriacigeorgica GUH-2]|uniref:Uncharacterized protein n=1 Tax=Nocardia cyriacigeorgica (strain GUH-2) TaxID=1127134 RepID=H6R9B5_NOCCG|nr:protein of unknown function [Nocardia cyriacigeorgica GUH-2]
MWVVVYGELVDYGNVAQSGLFGYFTEDRLLEGLTRVHPTGGDLGSCFGVGGVVED